MVRRSELDAGPLDDRWTSEGGRRTRGIPGVQILALVNGGNGYRIVEFYKES